MPKESQQKNYLRKRYLRELKEEYSVSMTKDQSFGIPQLKRQQRQLAVLALLVRIFPKWITFGGIETNLEGVSPKTISKVLGDFRKERMLDRMSGQRIPGHGKYPHTVYRLNLTKYCDDEFEHSAKSYVMRELEERYPFLLNRLALGHEIAKSKDRRAKRHFVRELVGDKGFRHDVEEIFKNEGGLPEMGDFLERMT